MSIKKIVSTKVPGDKGDLVKNLTLKITLQDPTPDSGGVQMIIYGVRLLSLI